MNAFTIRAMKPHSIFTALAAILALPFSAHALDLTKSLPEIRMAILKIAPLGSSVDEAHRLVSEKIRPLTLYVNDCVPNLPRERVNGTLTKKNVTWPLGGKNLKSTMGGRLGIREAWPCRLLPIMSNGVEAWWGFDANGRLIDVVVFIYINAM
jgi:hypothetical protein